MSKTILEVNGLKKYFPIRNGLLSQKKGYIYAVDGVSFKIKKGETLGLVGESGCGKSTLGRAILRLIKPTSGKVFFNSLEITKSLSKNRMKKLRRDLQIIFQDPYSSLNPRMKVENIIGDALHVHGVKNKVERRQKIATILQNVGLKKEHMSRYPHQFSGGQRQRISIARALVLNPKLIVCDEPVSALDVSIQAQIINMLMDLQEKLNLSYLFISHDLSVVKHISSKVAVMYLGKIVEMAYEKDLYLYPRHPYTQALLSAVPVVNPKFKPHRIILKGDVTSHITPPIGCNFYPRCQHRMDICHKITPDFKEFERDHFLACHLK